ncbi:unnamed protein product, partial [Rotaria magnacalcarata]
LFLPSIVATINMAKPQPKLPYIRCRPYCSVSCAKHVNV